MKIIERNRVSVHNGTVQYGPLRTLADDFLIHVGFMEKPS